MAQRRYFDYQSSIKSKTSAESATLASGGIGVKFGFNKVSVINSNKTLSISSTKNITLTNDKNNLERIKHVLITPDGIITGETDDIQLSLSDSSTLTEGAYFVIASHQYINSPDTIVPTSYALIKGNISLISELTKSTGIDLWYTRLASLYSGLNRSTTIIVALVEYHSSAEVSIYTPYNNYWPTDTEAINDILYSSSNLSGVKNIVSCSENTDWTNKQVSDRSKFNTLLISSVKYIQNSTVKEYINIKTHTEAYLTNFTQDSASKIVVGTFFIKIPNSYLKDRKCTKLLFSNIWGNMIVYQGTPSISDTPLKPIPSEGDITYNPSSDMDIIKAVRPLCNNPQLQNYVVYKIFDEGIVLMANVATYTGGEEEGYHIGSSNGILYYADMDLMFEVED